MIPTPSDAPMAHFCRYRLPILMVNQNADAIADYIKIADANIDQFLVPMAHFLALPVPMIIPNADDDADADYIKYADYCRCRCRLIGASLLFSIHFINKDRHA